MFPTAEQIEHEAYLRWERRGRTHGGDLDDWCAAREDLLLAFNYEAVAYHELQSEVPQYIGDPRHRVCRFCEQAPPQTRFSRAEPPLAIPAFLGNRSLFTYEECEDCRAQFALSVEADLARFLSQMWVGADTGDLSKNSIAALKGLARMALSILPAAELQSFEDTREWVINPDHEFDLRLFGELGGGLHVARSYQTVNWTALARRVDDSVPMPYMLFLIGVSGAVIQAPIPLSIRDEDLDGEQVIIPRTDSSHVICSDLKRKAPARSSARRSPWEPAGLP